MSPMLPRSVEVLLAPGRPSEIVLHLACGVRVGGIRVWRTSRGPRVLMPVSIHGRRPGFGIPPVLRSEWEASIVAAWRRAVLERLEAPSNGRRAA